MDFFRDRNRQNRLDMVNDVGKIELSRSTGGREEDFSEFPLELSHRRKRFDTYKVNIFYILSAI